MKICKLTRLNHRIQSLLNCVVLDQIVLDAFDQFEDSLDALTEPEAQEAIPHFEVVPKEAWYKFVALKVEKATIHLVVPATSAVSSVGKDMIEIFSNFFFYY